MGFDWQSLLREGWATTAACLAGALVLLAGLRRAARRAEVAIRDRLFVLLAAAGVAAAGLTPALQASPEALASEASSIYAEHPYTLAGILAAVAIAFVISAVVWWVRFWVKTMLRLAMLGAFLLAVLLFAIARLALVPHFDGLFGTSLGVGAWSALLDGGGVAAIVIVVLSLLGVRPSRSRAPE